MSAVSDAGESSQQIMHPGAERGGTDAAGEGAVFRRVFLLLGACGVVREVVVRGAAFSGEAVATPAATLRVVGLSMYFSISRSLFHPVSRRSSIAESNWGITSGASAGSPINSSVKVVDTHIDSKYTHYIVCILAEHLLDLPVPEAVVLGLVDLAFVP
jgi:hypothetical protein